MRTEALAQMVNGWFIGAFNPTAFATSAVEVGVKEYARGSVEPRHYHRIATEVTAVISGCVKMNGQLIGAGTVVVIEPLESTDFEAIEDSVTVVVKIPGALDDKYAGEVPA
jgi:hypothetical protein